jgi:hypothetical protein
VFEICLSTTNAEKRENAPQKENDKTAHTHQKLWEFSLAAVVVAIFEKQSS